PSGGGGAGAGGGFGGNLFGGATGPFRLLQSALGDQAGGLLGFAPVAGLALLAPPAPPPARSAHRLADRGWRRVRDYGRGVQLRVGDLPPLLRVVPRAVRGVARRRRRRHDAAALARRRARRPCRAGDRAARDRRR